MTEFERFARGLSLPALAEALTSHDPAELQGVYASLPADRRDAIGLAVLEAGPLDHNRLRHLKAVCASATLPAVLQAATSGEPGLAKAALDHFEHDAWGRRHTWRQAGGAAQHTRFDDLDRHMPAATQIWDPT